MSAIDSIVPEVSIIVVTYNNCHLNEACLSSLFHDTDYERFEVIVVDNASSDATPELLRSLASREPRLRIVLNAENRGFAAANSRTFWRRLVRLNSNSRPSGDQDTRYT